MTISNLKFQKFQYLIIYHGYDVRQQPNYYKIQYEVLANVVKLGKSNDQNLDVTRSSSLPTLLISIVRNLVKSDVNVPDLLSDLIENISLLCKNGFSKQVGIESIYMKGFIPLMPNLIKDKNQGL